MTLAESAGTATQSRGRRAPAASGARTILFGIASPILPSLESQWPSWLSPSAEWKPNAGHRSGATLNRRSL